MKHLPKHLQPRWRYLAVGVESWGALSRDAFQRQVWYAAQNLLGDPGAADADCSVIRFRSVPGTAEAIVRVRRGEVSAARAALACVSAVDGEPVGVRVRGVSGTIRACRARYWDTTAAAEERHLRATSGKTEQTHVTLGGASIRARIDGERVDAVADRVGATTAEVTED